MPSVSVQDSRSAFHLCGKTGCFGGKANGTGFSTGNFSEKKNTCSNKFSYIRFSLFWLVTQCFLPRFNGPQIKWSTDSKESFTYALNSDEIKQLIHDFELSNFEHVGNINTIVKTFSNILETAAKQSLKLVKQNKK